MFQRLEQWILQGMGLAWHLMMFSDLDDFSAQFRTVSFAVGQPTDPKWRICVGGFMGTNRHSARVKGQGPTERRVGSRFLH